MGIGTLRATETISPTSKTTNEKTLSRALIRVVRASLITAPSIPGSEKEATSPGSTSGSSPTTGRLGR